jgi:hypothetical protein
VSIVRPIPSLVVAFLAASPLLGCGARSSLDTGGHGSTGSAGQLPDICPAAVSGPKAMARNCSTRDGRSRVAAPAAPHVTWTTKLDTDYTGQVGPSAIATDASGHAYVVTTAEFDESVAALQRVRAGDGAIDWKVPITPDLETSTPIILASGGIDVFGYGPTYADSVFTFDPESGASTSTTFGLNLYYAPQDLAVGADGSLYIPHADGIGTAKQTNFVSRVGPDGTVLWTSVDLATLGPPPQHGSGDVSPWNVTLAKDDLVVLAVSVFAASGPTQVVSAFDPATGAVRWVTPLTGSLAGGPVVRLDGSIVVITNADGTSSLVVLDPETGTPASHPTAGTFAVAGVTEDGTVIAEADDGGGVTGLVALDGDGKTLWTTSGATSATITRDGSIVVWGPGLAALDAATGAPRWELPDAPEACIIDVALTSAGGLVALGCDGTLFGASD